MNIILLAQFSPSIPTVITNPFFVSGDEKDKYLTAFSNIKSSPPNFQTSRSSGHLDPISPFLTSSAETSHYQRQRDYNFNKEKFHTICHSRTRTVRKFTSPSSTKTKKTHLIMFSTPSSADKAKRKRLSDLKMMETTIMLKFFLNIVKSKLHN